MIEADAVGAAILGDDLHDFVLLLWREQVLAMMITVVGTRISIVFIIYTFVGLF